MEKKKYICEICNQKFTSINALRYHSFVCKKEKEIINEEYSSNIDLINQMAKKYHE